VEEIAPHALVSYHQTLQYHLERVIHGRHGQPTSDIVLCNLPTRVADRFHAMSRRCSNARARDV